MKKGQIAIPLLVAFGAVTSTVFGWNVWLTNKVIDTPQQIENARAELTKQISEQSIEITKVTTHMNDIDRRNERFEAKLDALLEKSHIDPTPFNSPIIASASTTNATP